MRRLHVWIAALLGGAMVFGAGVSTAQRRAGKLVAKRSTAAQRKLMRRAMQPKAGRRYVRRRPLPVRVRAQRSGGTANNAASPFTLSVRKPYLNDDTFLSFSVYTKGWGSVVPRDNAYYADGTGSGSQVMLRFPVKKGYRYFVECDAKAVGSKPVTFSSADYDSSFTTLSTSGQPVMYMHLASKNKKAHSVYITGRGAKWKLHSCTVTPFKP